LFLIRSALNARLPSLYAITIAYKPSAADHLTCTPLIHVTAIDY
jgi:hypothetical protein